MNEKPAQKHQHAVAEKQEREARSIKREQTS
jgi:hypothetical protein